MPKIACYFIQNKILNEEKTHYNSKAYKHLVLCFWIHFSVTQFIFSMHTLHHSFHLYWHPFANLFQNPTLLHTHAWNVAGWKELQKSSMIFQIFQGQNPFQMTTIKKNSHKYNMFSANCGLLFFIRKLSSILQVITSWLWQPKLFDFVTVLISIGRRKYINYLPVSPATLTAAAAAVLTKFFGVICNELHDSRVGVKHCSLLLQQMSLLLLYTEFIIMHSKLYESVALVEMVCWLDTVRITFGVGCFTFLP